jgi:hypothetical protein
MRDLQISHFSLENRVSPYKLQKLMIYFRSLFQFVGTSKFLYELQNSRD